MRPRSLRAAWPFGLSLAAAVVACAHGTAPSARERSAPAALAGEVTAHDVDEALRAAWKGAGIEPAAPVDDARFLRRAWLDLAGVVPPPEVVSRFLADPAPDKRRAAVAGLVSSPSWATRWANRWERLLLGPDARMPAVDRDAFRAWVADAFSANMPYDRFAYALVTASGRNRSRDDDAPVNGAVNWLLRFRDAPQDLAGTTSRVFLGVQIQCAQCHDHRTEKWTQDDFRRFTASFMHMSARPVETGERERARFDGGRRGGTPRPEKREVSKDEVEVRDTQRPAFLRQGRKKLDESPYARAAPAALDGSELPAGPDRRKALASWMIDPRNPWFARAFVNRVWADLLGRGIVEPVDDLRPGNPPLLPELLDRLAADFSGHGYDVRRLVRLLCDTEAYQISSGKPGRGDGQLWSRFQLQALGPDELLDSIVAATGAEPLLARLAGDDLQRLRADLRRQMSFLFDVDEQADDAAYQGTIPQALMLLNGRLVNGGASAIPGDALDAVLARGAGDAAAIEALYLRTLSRPPSPEELDHWTRFVNAPRDEALAEGRPAPAPRGGGGARAAFAGERRLARAERLVPRRETPKQQAFEDVLWALLNSSEFTFNH